MKKYLTALLFALILSCQSSFDSGMENYNNGYYSSAIKDFKNVQKDDVNYTEAQKYLQLSEIEFKKKTDSIDAARELEMKKEKAAKISENIKKAETQLSFIKSIKNSQTYNDISILMIEPEQYKDYALEAASYVNSENDTLKRLGLKLQKSIKAKQKIRFPQLRKNYHQLVKKKMWVEDIEVTTSNYGRTINFIGGVFAANKNKQDFQTAIQPQLINLRFKRSTYRWIPSADEYTYYDMNPKKDNEL